MILSIHHPAVLDHHAFWKDDRLPSMQDLCAEHWNKPRVVMGDSRRHFSPLASCFGRDRETGLDEFSASPLAFPGRQVIDASQGLDRFETDLCTV